jgi:hypothetical protein
MSWLVTGDRGSVRRKVVVAQFGVSRQALHMWLIRYR